MKRTHGARMLISTALFAASVLRTTAAAREMHASDGQFTVHLQSRTQESHRLVQFHHSVYPNNRNEQRRSRLIRSTLYACSSSASVSFGMTSELCAAGQESGAETGLRCYCASACCSATIRRRLTKARLLGRLLSVIVYLSSSSSRSWGKSRYGPLAKRAYPGTHALR
jgi:hypothetical protein